MDPIVAKSVDQFMCVTDTFFTNTFPSELVCKIFSNLSFASLRAGCLTCKNWDFLLKLDNNSSLWKQVVFQQNGCCSNLWRQHLGEISDTEQSSKTRDPALRLKEMGFVGLPSQGEEVIRTIIAERCSPLKEEIKKRSIKITNGVLVCGHSGTGKSLLARFLFSLLNCKRENIQLLSGPEIYNKWKERSEVDLGEIFTKTLKAAVGSKNQNETFLLAIDGIDAIFSSSSKESNNLWLNSAADEFIAKMNELKNVYNILVIGMTTHSEKIDEAVTRLGVFGKHIELAIPDLQERKEILSIFTQPLVEILAIDIDFEVLAHKSEGLTGANIKAFVSQAMSYTMKRAMETTSCDNKITMNDLLLALKEVKTNLDAKISSDM